MHPMQNLAPVLRHIFATPAKPSPSFGAKKLYDLFFQYFPNHIHCVLDTELDK